MLEEYQRHLDALSGGPRRHELDAVQRQGDKLRRAIDRLIDGFTEGLIAKHEFEPRIAQLRQRAARLEAEAQALRSAAEQARSLQLVIGSFAIWTGLKMWRGRKPDQRDQPLPAGPGPVSSPTIGLPGVRSVRSARSPLTAATRGSHAGL